MNKLLCFFEALEMWLNLMHHCGVDMSDSSYIFPHHELHPKILEGNYGRPIVDDRPAANSHHTAASMGLGSAVSGSTSAERNVEARRDGEKMHGKR